jgi:uncharacterized protein
MEGLEPIRRDFKRLGVLVLELKVSPSASKSEVTGIQADGVLKVRAAAQPERGKANREVCRLLAAFFGVPQRNVEILSGETKPRKRVRITAAL